MIPELNQEIKIFCAICEQRKERVIELIEVGDHSYVKRNVCLECFKKMGEG